MEAKRYTNAPSKEWWLVAMVVYHFLYTVNFTFDALQVDSGIVSKQYDNLRRLLEELQGHCSASRDESDSLNVPVSFNGSSVSKGQFSVTIAGMEQLLQGIDVDAAELDAELNQQERSSVLAACAILYLEALCGIAVVLQGRQSAGRESAPIPPCLPLKLIKTSQVDFVSLVSSHKEQLRSAFGDEFLQIVCQQHRNLVRVAAQEAPLMSQLRSKTGNGFSKFWAPCGSRFLELQQFAAGLATVMPTTSRVEGDFSPISCYRNEYCSAMTDFSLEGVLYSKQYAALHNAAEHL